MNTITNKAIKQLLWVGIGSITMFFAGLTSAYVVRKAEGNWTLFVLPDWFLYSTITIVLSSVLLIIVKKNIQKNILPFKFYKQRINPNVNEKKLINIGRSALMMSVFMLGLLFAFFQINGWNSLTNQGVYLTGEGSNVAGSFLYVLTLSHLVHLLGGLIALLLTSINTARGKYTSENYFGLELTSTYWHFLGALWVYLFFFLKYL